MWTLNGIGFLIGSCAFSCLFGKLWGAFVALGIVSAFFFGGAWVARRFMLPRKGEDHAGTITLVITFAFGGVGVAMLAGSVAQFIDGNVPAGIGLLFFGTIFGGVGFLARYLYTRHRRRTGAG